MRMMTHVCVFLIFLVGYDEDTVSNPGLEKQYVSWQSKLSLSDRYFRDANWNHNQVDTVDGYLRLMRVGKWKKGIDVINSFS